MSTQITKRALSAGLGAGALGAGVGALALLAQTQRASADTVFTKFAFPTTGTLTPRTMPDRLVEIKNVKDFGAVGDGVTDDQPAIQAAVNYVTSPYSSAKRGTIFFPPGLYQLGSPVTFELSDGITNISFVGVGGAKLRGNFGDALLKRSVNSPAGYGFIENLELENNHPAGKGIMFHSIVGGTILNCAIAAFIGIETYNSQSVTIQDCQLISGGLGGSSVGIIAGNATAVIATDVVGFNHGIRHSNTGLIVHGGRYEVNTIGIVLGLDANGNSFQSSSVSILGPSMESNGTAVLCAGLAGGHISFVASNNVAGSSYGLRVQTAQNVVFDGVIISTAQAFNVAGISLENVTHCTFNGCLTNDVWKINPGLPSYQLINCGKEIAVSQLPVSADVGSVFAVGDVTATTVGSTVAGGGSNHVAVVRSNGVWRII